MKDIKIISCYKEAFRLMVDGKSVMPVGKDKKPLLKSWKFLQERLPTEEELKKWWTIFPEANIGLITGRISNITVLDLDVGHDKQTPVDTFPETLTQSTPSGGTHLIYLYTEGLTVSANAYEKYPYTDVRSDGGFIVYAPSITPKGEYKIIKNIDPVPFPIALFPKQKLKRTLTEMTTASKGQRNDSLTSFTGKLLQSTKEEEWFTEVLPAVIRTSKTYSPVLPENEVMTIFNSIAKKEKKRRAELILSPFQTEDGQDIKIPLRKNASNVPFRDMANVVAVLENHPFYKNNIKLNTFAHDIEIDKKPLEDSDINKIQYFLQTTIGLSNIGKEAVYSAIVHVAQKNSYDEAIDWLTSLKWDGIPRLADWLHLSTGVENDEYHKGIGLQWFMQIIRRIMIPGCIADHVLVLVGDQGIGKTSLFRIIGGSWYKVYTGSLESKDFYLSLRKCILLDLDEGATLYRAESIKIKSIITCTEDEFRAPYDRLMKKYPRRFVFSLSTNDPEPFRDVTGNRRYWVLDVPKKMINFEWLQNNREALFAEAFYYFKNKIDIPQVPMEIAKEKQEMHLADDSWTDLVVEEVRRFADYCEGSSLFSTTIMDVFHAIFPDDSKLRLDKKQEMRVGNIFRKQLGLERVRKMVDGEQKNRWYITEEMQKKLQKRNANKSVPKKEDIDELVDELKDSKDKGLGF